MLENAPVQKFLDLHLHLDGAVTIEIAKALAALQGIPLAAESDGDLKKRLTAPDNCRSLEDFLSCFALPLSLMQTRRGLTEAVRLVAENVRREGVIYAEIRFAPQLHKQNGLTQEEAVLAALEGLSKTSLHANLILCCMRGNGTEKENLETLRLAEKYLVSDGGVVAIDLAGAEASFPVVGYAALFEKAVRAGVPFTIHAGEAAGPENIRKAIDFGAKRIGHGVRLMEDETLEKEVAEKGVFLEMCPTSNRQTHAIEDMAHYPLRRYLARGVRVTLNTDDMGIENTTIAGEFRYMRSLGLTVQEEKALLNNAVDAAFTSGSVKAALKKELFPAN